MKALKILHYPHPVLRQVAAPVISFDQELRDTLKQMLEMVYADDAVGLAANQVGILSRFFVMDVTSEKNQPMSIINPVITAREGEIYCDEGCLSLTGIYIRVLRSKVITLAYQDEHGEPHTVTLDGLAANCVQHELDHLDGILSIDKLSKLKRMLLLKKFEKLQKQAG